MTSALAPLGRLVSKDERDHRHLIANKRVVGIDSRHWYLPPALDQLDTPMCCGFAAKHELLAGPKTNKSLELSPAMIYKAAQKLDEWEGEDYEGTSVRAVAKFLKQLGYISEYKWAFDARTVINHILTTGPVIMGTNWYMSQFSPNIKNGIVDIEGEVVGGHAWLAGGANNNQELVTCLNSWGRNWGPLNGRFKLRYADLDRLIREDGEAMIGIEVKR